VLLEPNYLPRLLGEDLETRMPHLLAQFPEHTEDSIRDLAQYDPSGQAKFITWILRVLRETGAGMTPERGQWVRTALEQFNRIKNYPDFQGKKDINQYANFDELVYTMDEARQLQSKKQKEQSVEKITTWKDYTLWQIMTPAAAIKFAQNTGLCFCAEPHATNYTIPVTVGGGPPLYGVTKGADKVGALHPNSQQFHDMQNRPIAGELKRAVLHLCKKSGASKLLAWYQSKVNEATAALRVARARRAAERRRQLLGTLERAHPTVFLGRYGEYEAVAALPTAPQVTARLKEWRRALEMPVLALANAAGEYDVVLDLAAGNATNALGQQLSDEQADSAAEALEDYIKDDPRLREYIGDPGLYQQRFDALLANVHTNFVAERVRGYTSPANGLHYPAIPAAAAEAKWEAKEPAFIEAFQDGVMMQRDGRPFPRGVPSVGLMKVLERLR
jgi:hypothetical protein